jgi:non-heme chloroperoxidase
MRHHTIEGGGGTRLHLVETGNPDGRPVLFLHGFSQCWLQWSRQLDSPLAERCRLIAMDLRGHGQSDRPREGYDDARLWAADVHAAINALGLDRPVLCGWSYGPLVILDYVRHYGERAIAGACFVGGVTRLGSAEAASVLSADFLGLLPGFFSTEVEESVRALDGLIALCFARPPSPAERYMMLGYALAVPPHVRAGLFGRAFDNDDLLPKLRMPVLVVHGARDAIVSPAVIERQMSKIGNARVHVLPEAGHACFWDDADAFNERLLELVAAV